MKPSGQSDGRGTVTIPWCPRCERARLARACIECKQPLVLETFVPLDRAQRSEQLAWGLAGELRAAYSRWTPRELLAEMHALAAYLPTTDENAELRKRLKEMHRDA